MSLQDQEVTADDLAGLFRVSRRRIEQLAQQGTLTRVARGRYRLQDAVHAMLDELAEREGPSELQAERLRKLRAEATMAELELARQRGLVAPIAEFEASQFRFTEMVKQNMLQLPHRLTIRLLNESDETRFKEAVRGEVITVLTNASTEIKRVIQQMRDGRPINEPDQNE
ncbi:terminase small subunit [Hydrogenophaga intermedia]|uniref:terminase small subunit n=1 Tax=Hydrogenophaga intermedia TaxID=65786 RepID=UPI002043DB2F|nr:terminase small subunit [Hydrogenophaga intermedia]MCM3565194.1 terminase small subunit [Hydrogenophaga intermedia]